MNETSPTRWNKRALIFGIGLFLSVLFLYFALRAISLPNLWREIQHAHLPTLACSIATTMLGIVFLGVRLRVLFSSTPGLSLTRCSKAALAGIAGNNILPFRLGELIRIDYTARHGKLPRSHCLATCGVDRLFDFILLTVITISVLPVVGSAMSRTAAASPSTTANNTTIFVLAGAVVATLCALAFASRYPRRAIAAIRTLAKPFGSRLSEFGVRQASAFVNGLSSLQSLTRVIMALGAASGYWACAMLSIALWSWSFGASLPWYGPAVVLALTSFGTILPSAPAFVGTYHYFAKLGFTLLGVPEIKATSIAIVGHATAVIPLSLIAVVLLYQEIASGQLLGALRKT